MKLTTSSDFSEVSLKFAKQLGVTHLKINAGELMDEHQRGPIQMPKLSAAKKKLIPTVYR